MKNIYKIIAILLITAMLLCSCSTVVETQVQPTPTSTEDTVSLPTYITSVDDIGQIVYAHRGYNRYSKSDSYKEGTPFIQENNFILHNVDESLAKNITWNYLGVDFELQYEYSGIYRKDTMTDDYIDVYSTDPNTAVKELEVAFLHGTKQPLYINYCKFLRDPLKHISYNDVEEDYVNVIRLNNQEFSKDFTNYDLECVITYDKFDGEKVTYTNLDEVKNTGREVFRFEVFYHPQETSEFSVMTYPYFWMNQYGWVVYYAETDLDECKKPINTIEISEPTLWYAYEEAKVFAEKNFEFTNYEGQKVDFELALTPFLPSETKLDVLNGRLYLVVLIHLTGEWGSYEQGEFVEGHHFYIDYERLQQKMALEGKT